MPDTGPVREFADTYPFRLILDSAFHFPGEPRHPAPEPEIGPPTDPVALAEVGNLVGEFIAHYTKIIGVPPDLGEGCTEADLLAAEHAVGLRLPDDVRALYRMVEWDPRESGLLGRQSLLPLAGLVEHEPGVHAFDDGPFTVIPVLGEPEPHGHVRRVHRSDRWLTIAGDMSGNLCVLDLDPGPLGRRGQLIEYGRDFYDSVGYVAPSVLQLLRDVVAALRAGDYESEDERLFPGDGIGASAPVRPRHLESPLRLDLSHGGLAELAVIADRPGLRVLALGLAQWRHLRDTGSIPASLAAVELSGSVTPDEAREWATWF